MQCRIHKDSPIIPMLRLINPISPIVLCLVKMHVILLFQLYPGLPKGILPVGYLLTSINHFAYMPCSLQSSRFNHLLLGEWYILCDCSLENFFQSPFSFLLGPSLT